MKLTKHGVFILVCESLFFCIIFSFKSTGQSSQSAEQQIENLKNVIPPSPNASSLGKYGEWPVSLYTGVPSISIPIYDLKGRSVNVPISLGYHAAGMKVGEVASWVGLGWSLNSGGVISRTVRGLPDDVDGAGYFAKRQLYTDPNDLLSTAPEAVYKTHAVETAKSEADATYDTYTLSALGRSYNLLIRGDGTIFTMPHSNIKVTTNFRTNIAVDTAVYWNVVLEDGTKLVFGAGQYYIEKNTNPRYGGVVELNAFTSSWYLKSITAVNGETVNFKYTLSVIQQDTYFSQSDFISKRISGTGTAVPCPPFTEGGLRTSVENQQVTALSLSTIESDLTRVEFITDTSARQDLKGGKVLSRIRVFSKLKGTYVDDYKLNYTYSQAVASKEVLNGLLSDELPYISKRLKLMSVERKDPAGATAQKWTFAYNPQNLPSRRSLAQDHWGFFNGAVNNNTLLPPLNLMFSSSVGFIPDVHELGGNREGNGTYTQAEILNNITYPTGGYAAFAYEPNTVPATEEQFRDTSYTLEWLLRANTTPFITEKTMTFTITTPQVIHFYMDSYITPDIYNDQPGAICRAILYNPGDTLIIALTGSGFSWVNLQRAGTYKLKVFTNVGLESFGADSQISLSSYVRFARSLGMQLIDKPVGGLRIKSIIDFDGITGKKQERYFKYELPLVLNPVNINGDYLTTIDEYTYSMPNGTLADCQRTKYIRNSSTKFSLGSVQGGTVGYGLVTTSYGPNAENGKTVTVFSNQVDDGISEAKVFPYPPTDSREWRRGLVMSQTEYNAALFPVKRVTNTYDFLPVAMLRMYKAAFNEITNEVCNDIYGYCAYLSIVPYRATAEQVKRTSSTEIIFGVDTTTKLTVSTSYFYDNAANVEPTRIETIDSKGNAVKMIQRTAFEKADINAASPLSATASLAIDSMLKRNMVNAIIQQEQFNGSSLLNRKMTNYKLWSNNIILPENDQLQLGSNPMEKRVEFYRYDGSGNLQEQSKTNDAREVYIWGYNNQYPIAKIVGTTYDTAISFVNTSVLQNISATDQQLRDELNKIRTALFGKALVTTYTYLPLVGMTSETNPSGQTIYYEYDSFLRLKTVKDKDGKILKQYDYQYQKPLTQ